MKKTIFIGSFVIFWGVSFFLVYFFTQDNLATYASTMYPLDEKHVYTIMKNNQELGDGNQVDTPAGVAYVIVPKDGQIQPPTTNGRAIGKTDINLEPYLNKEVYINGEFYEGSPMFLTTKNIPDILLHYQRAVLHIRSLRLAK